MADASAREAVPSVATSADDAAEDKSIAYECNICYEMAREPVVTYCGHLYCWPCLYRYKNTLLSEEKYISELLYSGSHVFHVQTPRVNKALEVKYQLYIWHHFLTVRYACRWMQVQANCQSCPVCKAGIETDKVRSVQYLLCLDLKKYGLTANPPTHLARWCPYMDVGATMLTLARALCCR